MNPNTIMKRIKDVLSGKTKKGSCYFETKNDCICQVCKDIFPKVKKSGAEKDWVDCPEEVYAWTYALILFRKHLKKLEAKHYNHKVSK